MPRLNLHILGAQLEILFLIWTEFIDTKFVYYYNIPAAMLLFIKLILFSRNLNMYNVKDPSS